MIETRPMTDLYRNTVLEHSRHPRNFRHPEHPDRSIEGHNPLCGDKVTVYLSLDGDRIADIAFEGAGCAISLASASIMTETLEGLTIAEAREHARRVCDQFESRSSDADLQGDMAALAGVREYPTRIKCATLAWKVAESALDDESSGPVTTE